MNTLINTIYSKSQQYNFHTSRLGLVRSILALSTLIFLIFSPQDLLFHAGSGVTTLPLCGDGILSQINLFCVFSSNPLLAKYFAILTLLLVISGFLPRVTGIMHWWVAFSINTGLVNIDGGAQVAATLSFLLIPLTLTDNRINHWQKAKKKHNEYGKITDYFTIQVLKIQVAFIYFDAAISKLFASNWTDGTALYYFINDPGIGATGWRLDIINTFFDIPLVLVVSTYTVIILELLLVISIFTQNKEIKRNLFIKGVVFHIVIFLIFGIFTFVIAMFAALLFLLSPIEKDLNWQLPSLRIKIPYQQLSLSTFRRS